MQCLFHVFWHSCNTLFLVITKRSNCCNWVWCLSNVLVPFQTSHVLLLTWQVNFHAWLALYYQNVWLNVLIALLLFNIMVTSYMYYLLLQFNSKVTRVIIALFTQLWSLELTAISSFHTYLFYLIINIVVVITIIYITWRQPQLAPFSP